MTNTNNQSRPIYQKRLPGGISSAVFQNTREDGRVRRSVNVQRSYRKGDQWVRMGIYLDHEQIPFLIEALQGAWQFLNDYPVVRETAEKGEAEAESANAESAAEAA